jgi:GntR family transcriptional regulator
MQLAGPLDRQNALSLADQVRARLEQAVHDGELRPRERIPSERELSQHLGVSRMTVRAALQDLVAGGALYTIRGRGTFVAELRLEQPLGGLTSFTQDAEQRGRRASSKVLSCSVIPAPLDLAGVFGVHAGAEVVRISRLRLQDGLPLAIETSHILHELAPGLAAHDFERESLYQVLRATYGLQLCWARQTLAASEPTLEEQHLLEMLGPAPILRISRVTALADDRVAEFVRSAYRGDRYLFTVELR